MVTQLTTANFEWINPDEAYSNDYFKKVYENSDKIAEAEPSTKKGLENLVGITGERTLELTDEERSNLYQGVQSTYQSELVKYSLKNSKNLTNTLDEEIALNYAMQIKDFPPEDDEAYKAIAEAKAEFNEFNEKVKTDEGHSEYVGKVFENVDDRTKMIWMPFVDSLIQGDIRKQQKGIVDKLQAYDVGNFVSKTLNTGFEMRKEFLTASHELDGKINEALQAKQTELGRNLEPYEQLEIQDSHIEEFRESYKEQGIANQAFPQLLGDLQKLAYQTIKQAENSEEELAEAA